MLKRWLVRKVFDWMIEQDEVLSVARTTVNFGQTPEDQLRFWDEMDKWLHQREGLVYQALQQREFEALYDGLMKLPLQEKNDRALAIQTAKVQEASRVFNFPLIVKQRIKALHAHVKLRREQGVTQ